MDRIDDIKLDSDEDGPLLILQGDFVETFEKYIQNADQLDVALYIGPEILDGFIKEINEARYRR